MSKSPQMAEVEDVVADGEIQLRSRSGTSRFVRVKVGRPRHLSDVGGDDWLCPLWMEGATDGVKCFSGAGPVDSLMNAMEWVRERCEALEAPEPFPEKRSA